MQSTQPLCYRCQQNPAITTPRVTVNLKEVYNRLCPEYSLSAVQKSEVEELLLATKKDFDHYESELLSLQSRIAYIQSQQARLKEHMQRLRSLTSPVKRMPNEILCRIFDYSCGNNLLQEFPWGTDAEDPPTAMSAPALTYLSAMSISSVCARWRSIAVSLPSLRSRMSLETSSDNAKPNALNGFVGTVELYLLRSGGHLLDMTLDIRGYESYRRPTMLMLFDRVVRHCSRWRSFRLLGHHAFSEFAELFTDHPLELPALEELQLDFPADLDFFKVVPIRILKITCWYPSDLRLSPQFLTVLDVLKFGFGIESLLDQFPNLVEMRLEDCAPGPFGAMPACVSPKRYDSFTSFSLILSHASTQDGQLALDSLTLPSLVDLTLEVSKHTPRTDAWDLSALLAFLQRSAPSNLTSFTIQNVSMASAALKLIPSLINLTIDDATLSDSDSQSPITPHLIRGLHRDSFIPIAMHPNTRTGTSTGTSTALLPKLRCLKLYFDGTEFDDTAFIDMVSSRWLPDAQHTSMVGISCLRTVVMNFRTRAVDEEVYRPLHLFDDAGMMATVISQGRTLMFE